MGECTPPAKYLLKNKSTMRGYTSLSYTMHDKGKKKVNIKSKEFVLLLHIHVWTLYVCSVVLNPIRHRYMIGDSYRRGSKKGGGRGSGCPWENSYLSKLAKIGLWTPPPLLGIPLPWKKFWTRNSLKHTYKILLLKNEKLRSEVRV